MMNSFAVFDESKQLPPQNITSFHKLELVSHLPTLDKQKILKLFHRDEEVQPLIEDEMAKVTSVPPKDLSDKEVVGKLLVPLNFVLHKYHLDVFC